MKKKPLIIFTIIGIMLLNIPKVNGFEHIDNINDGISVYFLVSLDIGDNLEVNITHSESGNFTLFLFDTRPYNSYINLDNSLSSEIFDVAINYSLIDNPYLNYTIANTRIYYIQLILIENGPDTFFLYCNHELTRYYLPSIPAYELSLIITSILVFIPLFVIKQRKKIQKISSSDI